MINRLVDVTTEHEMMSFLDAFFRYNHILMHLEDHEKMAFMTHKRIYFTKSCEGHIPKVGEQDV